MRTNQRHKGEPSSEPIHNHGNALLQFSRSFDPSARRLVDQYDLTAGPLAIFEKSRKLFSFILCVLLTLKSVKKNNENADIIIITHSFGTLGEHERIYFGGLPNILRRFRCVKLLYVHDGLLTLSVRELFRLSRRGDIVNYPTLVSLFRALSLYFSLSREHEVMKFVKIIMRSRGVFSNLICACRIIEILGGKGAERGILTWEGLSRDRALIEGLRGCGVTNIDGYQYAPVTRYNQYLYEPFSSFRNFPDRILTSGLAPYRRIKPLLRENVKLAILGSVPDRWRTHPSPNRPERYIILLPENIQSELLIFLRFLSWILEQRCGFIPLIKLHPSTHGLPSLYSKIDPSHVVPKNKTIFDYNLSRSYCVYRGTSAIYGAVKSGATPLRLITNPDSPFPDPLDIFGDSIETLLTGDSAKLTNIFEGEWRPPNPEVFDYCANFYQPFSTEVILDE